MLSNKTQLAFTIGTRVYHFLADQDSPLNEAKEALFQFMKCVGQIEDAVKGATNTSAPAAPIANSDKSTLPANEEASKE